MNARIPQSAHLWPAAENPGGLIEDYLHHLGRKRSRSPLTLDSYRNDLHQFSAFLAESDASDADSPGDGRLLTATAETAAAYLDALKPRYTRSTLGRKLTALRGFYGFLVDAGRCADNPFERLHVHIPDTVHLEYLEEAHLQQLFDAFSGTHWLAFRDRAIIAVLYSTGMRVGELLALQVKDIDAETGAVHVRTPGRASRCCRPAPWAWQTVENYLLRRPRPESDSPPQTDALFINRDGNPLTARSIRRKLADYSRRAGLLIEATPAVLRHSCAIHMLRRGADPKLVRQQLGHLSTSSMRPYLNALSQTPPPPAKTPQPVEIAAH